MVSAIGTPIDEGVFASVLQQVPSSFPCGMGSEVSALLQAAGVADHTAPLAKMVLIPRSEGTPPDAEGSEGYVTEPLADGVNVATPAFDHANDDEEPITPQEKYYPSGERKRVRSACVACHERKLRCIMLKKGSCRHCLEKQRPCTPRVEKKRGRPRNSGRPHFSQPGFAPPYAVQIRPEQKLQALDALNNLTALTSNQLAASGACDRQRQTSLSRSKPSCV